MMEKFIAKAKEIYPGFFIPEEQRNYYMQLLKYFSKDKTCAWDLSKGLMITGPVGCGKSFSMDLFQKMFRGFQIIVTRYLVREFLQQGTVVIDNYGRECFAKDSRNNSDRSRPSTKCFDDLGLEEINQKLYGNQQNVMAEIMLDRYDMFRQYGMITHATTNLTPEMIEAQYGVRIRDRFREMFNYITLDGKTLRK